MSDAEADDYFLPLQDQRVFGAGVKRKRIEFIPASSEDFSLSSQPKQKNSNASDRYLSIVLQDRKSEGSETSKLQVTGTGDSELANVSLCAVCQQPILSTSDRLAINTHEATIAHQVCLEHSHPPSHLDRDNVGLKYLSEYGWDPDSKKGLGARLDGIRIPIKAKVKNDTTGLREAVDEDDRVRRRGIRKKEEKLIPMNAKDAKRHYETSKKKAEKLRSLFYDQDLEHYLGPAG